MSATDDGLRFQLARTQQMINEGKSLADIHKALNLPRARQLADLRASRLKAADELAEASKLAIADQDHFDDPNPNGFTLLDRNHPVLVARLRILERATEAYRRAVQAEDEGRGGTWSAPPIDVQIQTLDGIELLSLRARAKAADLDPELFEIIRQIHSEVQHLGILLRVTGEKEARPTP